MKSKLIAIAFAVMSIASQVSAGEWTGMPMPVTAGGYGRYAGYSQGGWISHDCGACSTCDTRVNDLCRHLFPGGGLFHRGGGNHGQVHYRGNVAGGCGCGTVSSCGCDSCDTGCGCGQRHRRFAGWHCHPRLGFGWLKGCRCGQHGGCSSCESDCGCSHSTDSMIESLPDATPELETPPAPPAPAETSASLWRVRRSNHTFYSSAYVK